MTDYWSYMALRLVTAAGSVGLFNEAFTMTVELMGSKEVMSEHSLYVEFYLLLYSDSCLAAVADLQKLAGKYHTNAVRSGGDGAGSVRILHPRLRHPAVGHVCHLLPPAPPVAADAGVPQVVVEQGQGGGGQDGDGEGGQLEQEDGRPVWDQTAGGGGGQVGPAD